MQRVRHHPGSEDRPDVEGARGSAAIPGASASPEAVATVEQAGTDARRRRMVIVPRRPGLLRDYEQPSKRPRDELDEFIDDLFGSTTEERPGRFDAGLVVVGIALIAWNVLLGGPGPVLWLGIAALVLGLALPVRAALRTYGWSRSEGLRRRILDRGVLLDASHPVTIALVEAYDHLIQVSCLQGIGDPKRTVAAGHMAVTEVAVHLEGQPPETPSRVRFVKVRTDAIEALSRQMLRSHDRWVARATPALLDAGDDGEAAAPATQFGRLDALARSGAVAELERLNEQLRRAHPDGTE